MKQYIIKALLVWLVMFVATVGTHAQKNETTTLILVRHAEKDTGDNPSLSLLGKQRAEKLPSLFPNAKPDEFYSTAYNRTVQTLEPWANARGKTIQTYDAGNQADFASRLKTQKGKTIVVAGHSNTIPTLANLLLNTSKYSDSTTMNIIRFLWSRLQRERPNQRL